MISDMRSTVRRHLITRIALGLLVAVEFSTGQIPPPNVEFEVVSVRQAPVGTPDEAVYHGGPGTKDPGRISYSNFSLEGFYDFTLIYESENARESASDGEQRHEPPKIDKATIPSEVEQQLGLRLLARRAPVRVLVIERAEKVPLSN